VSCWRILIAPEIFYLFYFFGRVWHTIWALMRWWLDWNRVLNRWGGRQFRVSRVKSFTLWPQMRTLADCWSCNFGTFGTSLFFPRPRIHHFSPWSNFVLVASAADVVATAFVLFDSLLSVRLDGARDSHQIRTWKCFNERHEKNEIKKGQRVWRVFFLFCVLH
jgi:hypothetical protein